MKRKMKDSGIEWIGEIPEEWELEKSKNIFTLRSSKGNHNPVLLAATQEHGMIPQDRLSSVVRVNSETDLQTFKTVHKGDFVISLRSFQGGFELSEFEGVCSPAYQVFYNERLINHTYFKYLFKSDGFISQINALTVGIREGKNIQFFDFANSTIPVPSVEEQKKISEAIENNHKKIDKLIEQLRYTITDYKALKQSIITEVVTKGLDPDAPMKDSGVEWIGKIPEEWDITPIKNIFSVVSGSTPNTKNPEFWDKDINWITPADYTTSLKYISSGKRNISKIGLSSCSAKLIPKGSIVFSKRAPIGTVSITSSELCTNQGCLSCIKSESENSEYYYYMLSVLTAVFENLGSGTTFKEISLYEFNNFCLPHPSLEEQSKISTYLSHMCLKIDSLVSSNESLITELEAYRKSLIYEAVTGKIEV